MKYLRIYENGDLSQSNKGPTGDDIEAVGEGILNVVRIENGIFEELQPDGSWLPVPSAE